MKNKRLHIEEIGTFLTSLFFIPSIPMVLPVINSSLSFHLSEEYLRGDQFLPGSQFLPGDQFDLRSVSDRILVTKEGKILL